MKRYSIRLKITFWFAAALAAVVGLTYFVILSVSDSVMQKNLRDDLAVTVESNADEVEFFAAIEDAAPDGDGDEYIRYNGGFLEIDDDFLDSVNGICTSLCDTDGALLYGENPAARASAGLALSDRTPGRIRDGALSYHVYDVKLSQPGLEGLWLRGVVSTERGKTQLSSVAKVSLVALPVLVVLALLGGYVIAGRMLAPVRKISEAAERISHGSDLKRRIGLGEGRDELHSLANTFDGMFARLDSAFETERQFTGNASHELRTPVSVILSQCEYTLAEQRTPEEYEQALRVIRRQGGRMSRLIADMLEFTRIEQSSAQKADESVDTGELAESVCGDMALLREKGISLTCEAEPGLAVAGDRALLTRLLSNLISNAYRYGREGGFIRVTVRSEGEYALIAVADDGIGISAEDCERIFHRFYQADPARNGAGSGLGLAMVREIALMHGGEVTVRSKPGEGSVFEVRLPLKK